MKKAVIIIGAVIFHCISYGQVIVNLQLPQTGLTVKGQLWNLTLTNSSREKFPVRINLIMTDAVTGQQVLAATSNILQIGAGSKIIQYNDVVPVNYSILNNNYNIDPSPNGFLPIGNFNVCYEIVKQVGDVFESINEECVSVEIEPVSPPLLNFPDDESVISERQPLFAWLPPSPLTLFKNVSYGLNLVEVFPNQTAANAIKQNIPLLSSRNITGLTYQYLASNKLLDTGKIYAWQVSASTNNNPVAQSEVWTFSISMPGVANEDQKQTAYFKLETQPSSGYFVCDGILKFEYDNELNDTLAQIKIQDITHQNKKEIRLDNNIIFLKFGQNLLDIDIKHIRGFVDGHIYLLQFSNSGKETWYGRFLYKQ